MKANKKVCFIKVIRNISLASVIILLLMISCSKVNPKHISNASLQKSSDIINHKPGSTFQDTLLIKEPSAIFYQPDSIQLDSIRSLTEKRIFESSMHEYEYQIKTSRKVLMQSWSQIPVIEAKNVRYLKFLKSGLQLQIVDLNTFNDAYGLFIFNSEIVVPVDMSNSGDAFYLYFKK